MPPEVAMAVPLSPMALAGQADVLLALARLLTLPSATTQTASHEVLGGLAEVAGLAGFSPETVDLVLAACGEAAACTLLDWQGEYQRCFGPTAVVPIHEAQWVKRDRGPLMADIAAFARAFGLTLDEASQDRYDHLACELEILAMLLVLQARAIQEGSTEGAGVCSDAIGRFVEDHPGFWVPSFCAGIIHGERHPVYAAAGPALARVWDELCAQHGWRVQPLIAPRGVDPDFDSDSPYGCGGTRDAEAATQT